MALSPREALDFLISAPRRKLDDLPVGVGLYGLGDHEGVLHYFGMTESDSFRDRIWHRHITGSEDRSHKLACNYSVGRMWYDRKHPGIRMTDGAVARRVRREVIRRYCVFVCLPLDLDRRVLKSLETGLIDLAWPHIADWNKTRKRVATFEEPRTLVDGVIRDMGLIDEDLAALERQEVIYRRLKIDAPIS